MQISTGKKERAQKVVLYGPEGIGKTSLAAAFPDPLFIDLEDGTASYDVKRAEPAPTSWAMLMQYISEASRSGCATVVIDTADAAERLCVDKVCSDKGWSGIEDASYGKGYKYVNEEFAKLLNRLSDVAEAGVNVVVTAHARISKFEQPDEMGAYDRWSMKLIDTPKASNAALLKEWADMVLFCNFETYVVESSKEDGKRKKAQGGKRVMFTQHHPCWDAKNRHGLPGKLPLDYAGIAACIPDLGAPRSQATPQPQAQPKPEPKPAPEPPMKLNFVEVEPESPDTGATIPDMVAPVSGNAAGVSGIDRSAYPPHMGPLLDLMEASGASEADVTSYVEAQGWYPAGTPLAAYEESAVKWLVANWQTVGADIPTPIK